jgi:hypothetical protein
MIFLAILEIFSVVRVVAVTGEGRRELHAYAADGRLVSTTLQLVPR